MPLWDGRTFGVLTPNGTTTHTVATPRQEATAAGAYLVLVTCTSTSVTTPSGWTAKGSPAVDARLSIFVKVANAGEATVNIVTSLSNYAVIYELFDFPVDSYIVHGLNVGTAGINSTDPWDPLTDIPDSEFYYAALAHGGTVSVNSPPAGTVWDGTGLDELQWIDGLSGRYLQFSSEYLENPGLSSWTPTSVTTLPTGASDIAEIRIWFGLHVPTPPDPTGALSTVTAAVSADGLSNYHGPITFVYAGATVPSGTAVTAINPYTPLFIEPGDLTVLTVVVKPYNATIASTGALATWTKIGEYAAGTTANARADEGSTKVAVFVKESAALFSQVGAITLTGANTATAMTTAYRKASNQTWDFSAWTAGGQGSAAVNYDATGSGGLDLREGDWVLACTGIGGDAGTVSSSAEDGVAGSTLGTTALRGNAGTTTGYDCRIVLTDAAVTSGNSIAAPTYHHDNASSLCGTTLFLRLRLPYDYGTTVMTVLAECSADGFLQGDLVHDSDPLGVICVPEADGLVEGPPYVTSALLVTRRSVYVINGVTPMVTEEIPVDEGDVIIVKAVTADSGTTLGTPVTDGQSYTLWHTETTGGVCGAWMWGSVITGDPGLVTVSVDKTAGPGQVYAILVERWANVTIDGTPVVNSVTLVTSDAGFVDAITSTDPASAVTWVAADKSARSPLGTSYRAFARQVGLHDASATNDYVAYFAMQDAPGVGQQEFGLNQP